MSTVTTHTDVDATLGERGARYGRFEEHAVIAQDLQRVIHAAHGGLGWANLADDQRQALTVICDKIARMLNGDPTYRDNWHDIVGYAKLVDERMIRDEAAAQPMIAEEALREIQYKPTRKGVEISAADYQYLLTHAGYKP